MADQLPSEIMYNIFSRMPVKTLARFRCVSKLWCNHINDSYLETMHAKRAAVDNSMLIMIRRCSSRRLPNASCCKLSFLEYKEQEKGSCSTLKVRKKPQAGMKFMCKRLRLRYPDDRVLGSCNGLLYSSLRHRGRNTLVVIHPLRKECYESPPIMPTHRPCGIHHVEESHGLGFDDSTNTFKMVSVVCGEEKKGELCTMVHVLGTNSWRKIPQVPSYPITGDGVFANGCLHWLIADKDLIVSFDMTKEEFGLINPPQETRACGRIREQLVDLDGELGYVYHNVKRSMEVWVLKERGWVLHCVFKHKRPLPRGGFIKVLGFWNRNGDILMTDYLWNRTFVYNLRNGSFIEVGLVGRKKVHNTGHIRMYRSSLFTTRYSIKK